MDDSTGGPIALFTDEMNHQWKVMEHIRGTISSIDTKASAALVFAGALLAGFSALLLRLDIKVLLDSVGVAGKISLLGCAAICFCAYARYVYCACSVLWARSGARSASGTIFFADILSHSSFEVYDDTMAKGDWESRRKDVNRQVFALAQIADAKVKRLNQALLTLFVLFVAWSAMLVLVILAKW
jgi:hypothetical protein